MFAPTPGTVITATTPACRQLSRQFDAAQRGDGALLWDSPDILPREAWLRRTWQECAWSDPTNTPVLLTRWQELTLWEEAIESTTRDVLLNSHATAFVAFDAWQLLHAWPEDNPQLSPAWDEARFDSSDDTRAFFSWMRKVRQRLYERGWITMAEIAGALHSRVRRAKLAAPITLYGFDEIATADRRLFDSIGARELTMPPCAGRVARAASHDAADELTQAALWVRQRWEAHTSIGVLVPGLASVATQAERIFDDVLHPSYRFGESQRAFAISAGGSLAEGEMAATALLTLRLMQGVPRDEAAMIWRSPFLGIEPGEAARLDVALRRQKVESANLHVEPVKSRFSEMAAFSATLRPRMRPSQWSAAFARILRLAGWPGPRTLTPWENRTLDAWKDALSELARLDVVLDFISCDSAISRLESIANATRIGPEDENAPIQILDIADSAGLRFDALWIAGLHAGAWPPRPRPNPFLPLALQRAAGMPHCSAERESAYATRITERLLTSAEEVVCSFPAHAADEEQRPSPFIAALPLLPELPSVDTATRRVFSQAPALECRPAEGPVPLPMGTLQRGGSFVLADQSACPFRAFAIHRLRAREMDDVDVGLSRLERGSVVHKALELLWKELRSQERLKEMSSAQLDSLIRSSAESALGHFVSRREDSRALEQFRRWEQPRLEGLLRQWLEIEKSRTNFVVIRNEDERSIEIAGLTIEIRVDRIDRYDDGTHAIVDYKTSKKVSADMWDGERPEAPQLPIYATTSGLRISDVAFGQLTTESVEWEGLRGNALQDQLPIWGTVVRRLAKDFLNGRAEVDPREKPDACKLCKLSALCRVTEIRKTSEGRISDE